MANKLVNSYRIDKQIKVKNTFVGSKKSQWTVVGQNITSDKPRTVYKGNKYMVRTLNEYANGDLEYILYDDTVLKFPKGDGVAGVFSYTSGFVDKPHKVRNKKIEEEAAKAAKEKSGGSSGGTASTTTATTDGTTPTSNEKSVDSSYSEEETARMKDITKNSLTRALLSGGSYVRGVVNGQETFLRDSKGNLIKRTADFLGFKENNTGIADSKYGGNVTKFMKSIDGIHGMPYKFLQSADMPLKGDGSVGRVYKRHILDHVPLLLLTPGVPKFMDEFDDDTKSDVITALGKGASNVILDQIAGDESGMYYTFEYRFSEYFQYVNTMLNAMANLLGIGGIQYKGTSLATYKWQNFATSATKGMVTSHQSVPFYVEAEAQSDESFQNQTGPSQLAEQVNQLSSFSKEIQFVLGGVGGAKFKEFVDEKIESVTGNLSTALGAFSKILPARVVNKLMGGFGTLIGGGKIVFPSIWQESAMTRSQSYNMRFNAPSGDTLTIYLEILVPLVHLICMCAPRQMGPNGYQSPYIVRSWYKGVASTDLGIIQSLSIKRGDKCRFNKDGLPTCLEVSITIEDLYHSLSITKRDSLLGTDLLNNPLLLGYMSTLCGINSYKPDILRTWEIYKTGVSNIPSDIITGIYDGVTERLTNLFSSDLSKNSNISFVRDATLNAAFELGASFGTISTESINDLVNHRFKAKEVNFDNMTEEEIKKYKKEQESANPYSMDMYSGVERRAGESDLDYAKRVSESYSDRLLKSSSWEINKSVEKKVEKVNKDLKKDEPKFSVITIESYMSKNPGKSPTDYNQYVDDELKEYKKKLDKHREDKNKPK